MEKSNPKQFKDMQHNPLVVLPLGIILLGLCYGAASWAIDSGRWSLYAVTFISFYCSVLYIVRGVKLIIRK